MSADFLAVMNEHGHLSFEEISKRKWIIFEDELRQKIHYIDGFRGLTNANQNAIMIITEMVKDHGWPNKRPLRTITIACGPYGEEGYDERLKVGTSIAFAKTRAMQIVKESIGNGFKFYNIAS